jgi:hypothetical protein
MSQSINASTEPSEGKKFHLPDGTRSDQSPWVWRGLFFMSLVALGLCLTVLTGHHYTFAILWGIIAAGWFTFSMYLWRRHTNYMDG